MSLASQVSRLASRVGQEIKALSDRPIVQSASVVLATSVGSRSRTTVLLPIPIDGTRPYLATMSPIGLSVSTQVMPVAAVSHPKISRVEELSVAATSLMSSAGDITWELQVIGYPAP